MEKFIGSIKGKYRERLMNREKQWPPCCVNKLIRLELAGQKIEVGKSIEYGDIFKMENCMKQIRKVLVEGDAGMGKTTLCTSISEDWANEKILQQFELLLLLSLRHKKVASASSLPELLKLFHASQNVCKLVADSIEENEGKGVLIIADGWDELSERQRLEGSFMYELIFGELLPFVSLVLTSRPTASASLHNLPCIDRFAVVRGFNKDNIKEYILSEFSSDQEKAERLLEELQRNPLIESVCSVPLNCTIICHLWRILEEALPTTMTELYTKIILNVVLRNIQKKDAFKNINNLPSFSALPEDLQQSWWLLCEFALQTLREDQLVFSREELVKFFPHGLAVDDKVLCFGLLQSTHLILETGYGLSFHFLHLTFQEYLAAMYLVKKLPHKQADCRQLTTELELFQYGNNILKRFSVVLRFLFGLYSSEIGHNKCPFIQSFLNSMSKRHIYGDKNLFLCHCVFEAKIDKLITSKVLQSFQNIGPGLNVRFGQPYTAYDCAAVLHVISSMHECRGIEVEFNNSGIKEDQIKILTNILTSKQGKLPVKKLHLSGNKLTDSSVSDLFCRASAAFYLLENIDLSNNRIGSESIQRIIFDLVRPPSSGLSKLDLSNNFLGVCGMQALENVQFSGSLAYLYELRLQRSFPNDADISSALVATSLEIVLANCDYLSSLDLSNNNLGVPGASAIGKIISQQRINVHPDYHFYYFYQRPRIWSLDLNETNLSDRGLCEFVECLQKPCEFSYLGLRSNGISASGVSFLAQAVGSGRIVMCEDRLRENELEVERSLDLSNNPLGVAGAIAACKIFSNCNFQLKEINLSNCQLSLTGGSLQIACFINGEAIGAIGHKLCKLLQNDTIRYLDLRGNNFTREGIQILAAIVYLCPCVEDLRTISCGITSNDLRQLLDRLTILKSTNYQNPCRKLEVWHLSMNKIDDKGVLALVEHLPLLFPRLGYGIGANGDAVFLYDNPINNISEGMRRLNEEMERRRAMPSLEEYILRKRNEEEGEKLWQNVWNHIVGDLLEAAVLMLSDYPLIIKIIEEEKWDIPNINDNQEKGVTNMQAVSNPGSSVHCFSGSALHLPSMSLESLPTICETRANQPMTSQEYATTSLRGENLPAAIGGCNPMMKKSWDPAHESSDNEIFTTPPSSVPQTDDEDEHCVQQGDRLVTIGRDNDDLPHLAETLPSTHPQLKNLDLIKLLDWEGVGLQLGIENYELQKIRVDYQLLDDRKREMFRTWLRTCTNTNYHNLIKALKAAGETGAAQELQKKI